MQFGEAFRNPSMFGSRLSVTPVSSSSIVTDEVAPGLPVDQLQLEVLLGDGLQLKRASAAVRFVLEPRSLKVK